MKVFIEFGVEGVIIWRDYEDGVWGMPYIQGVQCEQNQTMLDK